jgi:MYXO-CTERM domain-containing protein
LLRPALLVPALALGLAAPALAGPVAPYTWDTCFSDRNGLGGPLRETRSCANVVASGSYGYANAGIGNGRAEYTRNGNGVVSAESDKDGWRNRAVAATDSGGNTWASSDLTTGQLRSWSETGWPIELAGGVQTFNLARMGDVLTLVNTSGADQRVRFGYSFDGGFVNSAGGTGDYGYVQMNVATTSGLKLAESGNFLNGASNTTQFYGDGTLWHEFFNGTEADRDLSLFGDPTDGVFGGSASLDFILPPGESDFVFSFNLYVQCRSSNAACDFGNTGKLAFGALPQGVSFRSQSGVFLTGLNVGTVPEPASWALALLPLGLVGATRWRRRR